jgi:hypothetical protein
MNGSRGIRESMRTFVSATLLGTLALFGAGCHDAMVGRGGVVSVPSDARTQCMTICTDIGMSLNQVVVMANEVGCVCDNAKAGATSSSDAAGGAAGGMVAILEARRVAAQQASSTYHH